MLVFDRYRDMHRKALSHAAFRLALGHERRRDYHRAGRSTSYELQVTKCELQITNFELGTASIAVFSQQLERDRSCELYAAWSTASQEWITDAHVARCSESQGTDVVP